IKASSEYQDAEHPIHKQSAEHKRMLETHVAELARRAGMADPGVLARQLLLLKEGAIVTAHLGHTRDPAADARAAAETLIEASEAASRLAGARN
ncbi:MAG: TetR/AcrR family transcriptional regulator, partial [Pseudomonadota bacterium]|nr:TetR/AcrR family transcriptional regulator [Pseudomonadota bacterium]